mgnify:FL=1
MSNSSTTLSIHTTLRQVRQAHFKKLRVKVLRLHYVSLRIIRFLIDRFIVFKRNPKWFTMSEVLIYRDEIEW